MIPALVRGFLADYARNRTNLLVLVLVPVAFVVAAAPALADAARLLGGQGGAPAIEAVTAGWASAFISALAMYFQVSAGRDTDRRLVLAGLPGRRLAQARVLCGLIIASLASAAALLALVATSGLEDPGRVVAGTVMFSVIYLGIGAAVGSRVRNPVNGTVLILFIWILDVFFGPTLSGSTQPISRALPTHFVSLWMVGVPSGHEGRLGDLGWALAWTAASATVALVVIRPPGRAAARRTLAAGSRPDQLRAALGTGLREWRRNPVLWVLLAVVPAVFVLLADAITPSGSTPVVLNEGGTLVTRAMDPAHMHAGTMAPIAVASLATLAGLFLALDARSGDQRLTLAGMRSSTLASARLTVVSMAATLATVASLAVTALVFDAHQWVLYGMANLLVALTYAFLGVIIGPVLGRVSGVFVAFLLPFMDLGIAQSPMLRGAPPGWAEVLPGYGGIRVLTDAALTSTFDEAGYLVLGLGWLAVLAAGAWTALRRSSAVVKPRTRRTARGSAPTAQAHAHG
ncbi:MULTISPECIES: ABC transporter permease [Cellulomonas]|uniref:ABC transporter permease n=1 Tax=Cellulomonas TaxID=1707 RepID=UPI0015847B8F|nr:ABC transporter permease [Cellulomonas humilata]